MSEWENIVSFNEDDFLTSVKGGSDTGGSGSTPPISLILGDLLYDERLRVCTDENENPMSMEGVDEPPPDCNDYLLRDENGLVLTDENDDDLTEERV